MKIIQRRDDPLKEIIVPPEDAVKYSYLGTKQRLTIRIQSAHYKLKRGKHLKKKDAVRAKVQIRVINNNPKSEWLPVGSTD